MDIISDLNWRYAVKEFDASKKVTEDQLNLLLDATRLSASSFGLQPWKFVVVEDQETKEKLLPLSWNQRQVVDASHVIVFCQPTSFGEADVDRFVESIAAQRNSDVESIKGYRDMMVGFLGRLSEDGLKHWMRDQIYLALGNLLTVCATQRIDSCPMEGFSAPDYDKVLGLDKLNLNSVVVCPVGYRSEGDKYASAAKVRYSLEDLVVRL